MSLTGSAPLRNMQALPPRSFRTNDVECPEAKPEEGVAGLRPRALGEVRG